MANVQLIIVVSDEQAEEIKKMSSVTVLDESPQDETDEDDDNDIEVDEDDDDDTE